MKNKKVHDSETLAVGKQVVTACAFIHQNINGVEKVFMAKRADTKKFLPGVYELPGGHIDFGEEVADGLKREVFEEFGVRIDVKDPFAVFSYMNQVKGSHSIEIIYFARLIDSPEQITINPEYHSVFGWFSQDELKNIFSPDKLETDKEYQAIFKGFKSLK